MPRATSMSFAASRGWSPAVGSSSTISVPVSEVPSAAVSATRWTSPPESVRDARSMVR